MPKIQRRVDAIGGFCQHRNGLFVNAWNIFDLRNYAIWRAHIAKSLRTIKGSVITKDVFLNRLPFLVRFIVSI